MTHEYKTKVTRQGNSTFVAWVWVPENQIQKSPHWRYLSGYGTKREAQAAADRFAVTASRESV